MAGSRRSDSGFKKRQRLAWGGPAAGYHAIAQEVQPLAERLLVLLGVTAGEAVLDAAAGTGITAISAARRGARVTALDFAAPLLEAGRAIAERGHRLEGIDWVLGDVEEMPFEDGRFDAVVSTVGAIFAPDMAASPASCGASCARADGWAWPAPSRRGPWAG